MSPGDNIGFWREAVFKPVRGPEIQKKSPGNQKAKAGLYGKTGKISTSR